MAQAKLYIAIALFVAGILTGWTTHSWKTDAALKAELEASIQQAQEFKKLSDELESAYLQVASQLNTKEKETIRYVTKVITKEADARCDVNAGFVRLHDNSLRGQVTGPSLTDGASSGVPLSSVGSIVTSNYFTCVREIEKLKTLQNLIKEYQEKNNAVN